MIDTKRGAIDMILNSEKEAVYVTSTGLTSREFAEANKSHNYPHFPVMGAMGNAAGVGIGIALNTKKKVVVVGGDADALMGAGNMCLIKHLDLPNLVYYILDNKCSESTGGQPTIGACRHFRGHARIDVINLSESSGEKPPRITKDPTDFVVEVKKWLRT